MPVLDRFPITGHLNQAGDEVRRAERAHEDPILNWFRAKGEIFSGAVEGVSNKIQAVTRRPYGFRSFHAMEIALHHPLGRLPEPECTHKFR